MLLLLRLRRLRPPADQRTERPSCDAAGWPGRSVAAPTSAAVTSAVTAVATGIAIVAIVIVGVGVPLS